MNKFFKIAVLCSLVLSWAAISPAMHDLFKGMDENNDGFVSREEFTRDIAKNAFDELDTDKDGYVTPEEWNVMHFIEESDNKQEVFQAIDRESTKRISFPEFKDYADKYSNIEEAFMTMDKNKDGGLSPDEVTLRPLFRLITIRY